MTEISTKTISGASNHARAGVFKPSATSSGQRAGFDELHFVAEREVIRHGEKNLKQHGTRHQQQKNRLPDEFHEGVDRNVSKLTHELPNSLQTVRTFANG